MNKGFFVTKKLGEKLINVISEAVRSKKLNLGLFFDKYVLWWREDIWKCSPEIQISLLRKVYSNSQEIEKFLDQNLSGKKFREKITKNVRLSVPFEMIPFSEYKFYKKRMTMLFSTLEQMGFYIKYLPNNQSGLSLNWRLIINLGTASVYETSLLFHRNYSVPYIPGSAVKGVTRHWAILKFAEKLQGARSFSFEDAIKEIDKALENGKDLGMEVNGVKFSELIEIFGTQNKKGEVIFFDALPIIEQEKDFIVLDIMNVHYKPYYEKGETPGDWHSPTPIFFLAVEKGTKFRFTLASKNKNEDSKNKDLVKKAKELLKEALENIGIGAKTSAGYGYFE